MKNRDDAVDELGDYFHDWEPTYVSAWVQAEKALDALLASGLVVLADDLEPACRRSAFPPRATGWSVS